MFLSSLIAVGCSAGRYAGREVKPPVNFKAGFIQQTLATYYDDKFEGRITTNGEVFRQNKISAAHTSFPMGTLIKVVNKKNGLSITVRVNDRMPENSKGRDLDLSKAAAIQLDMIKTGIIPVEIEVISLPEN